MSTPSNTSSGQDEDYKRAQTFEGSGGIGALIGIIDDLDEKLEFKDKEIANLQSELGAVEAELAQTHEELRDAREAKNG